MTATFTVGSETVSALEQVYAAIRQRTPELPEHVLFVTGDGKKGRRNLLGHWWGDRWSPATEDSGKLPELFIAGQTFAGGPKVILETLLHEAAHALADARGIKDTSRQNRYHNKRFVALAEELGLVWPEGQAPHSTIGYSAVELTDATAEEYSEELEFLTRAVKTGLPGFQAAAAKASPTQPKPKIRVTLYGDDGPSVELAPGTYDKVAEFLRPHTTEEV